MEQQDRTNIIYTKFLEKITSYDFFKTLLNVILYPADFNITIGDARGNSVPEYFKKFLQDLKELTNRYTIENKRNVQEMIKASSTLLKLRSTSKNLITYSTIDQHYTPSSVTIKNLLQSVKDEQIEKDNTEEFKRKTDQLITTIDYSYDFLKHTIGSATSIQEFVNLLEDPNTSVVQAVQQYKELALQLNTDLSGLTSVSRDETIVDYYCLSDINSASDIAQLMSDNLCNNYSFYNTGINAFDNTVKGFESSSVHIVMAPSNNGKSIMLSNLFFKIAEYNRDSFEDNDAAIFISCEDDLIKCNRKFASIFGNYTYSTIREVYRSAFDVFQTIRKNKLDPEPTKKLVSDIFNNLLENSIVKTTAGKLKLYFKYAPEGSFSAADIAKQIDKFKHQGINIKFIVIDYLDTLKPSINNSLSGDYDIQGVITQELRSVSRQFSIPVITATQTNKEAEKMNSVITNASVGESWKKVKFSDFIYGQKIIEDKDLFDEDVKRNVFKNGMNESYDPRNDPNIQQHLDELRDHLKIVSMTVTKSKEAGKGMTTYFLLCNQNLKIYNTVEDYISDINKLKQNDKLIENKISEITNTAQISSLMDNPIEASLDIKEIISL